VTRGYHRLADRHLLGVAERQRLQSALDIVGVDFEDRDVGLEVQTDQLRRHLLRRVLLALEDHVDAVGPLALALDDVGVGEDVAVIRNDEPAAEPLAVLGHLEGERPLAAGERGDDHHHAASCFLVDLSRRKAFALDDRRGDRPGRGRRRGVSGVDVGEAEKEQHHEHQDGAHHAADQTDQERPHFHCGAFLSSPAGVMSYGFAAGTRGSLRHPPSSPTILLRR